MNDLVGVVFALFTLWVIARIIGGGESIFLIKASREGRSLGRNTEQMQQMVRAGFQCLIPGRCCQVHVSPCA